MGKERVWFILNVALGLISVLLLLNLFGAEWPSLGKARTLLSWEEPFCAGGWKEEINPVDLDSCCLAARKQLECVSLSLEIDGKKITKECHTGKFRVLLNEPAYQRCREQSYWKR